MALMALIIALMALKMVLMALMALKMALIDKIKYIEMLEYVL